MIAFTETPLKDLKIVDLRILRDERGSFQKLLNVDLMQAAGVHGAAAEIYMSESDAKVLRGLHFQLAPRAQAKLVYCLSGRIFDAVVDLRKDSVTFGQSFGLELPGDASQGLYVPEGFAHGLQALESGTRIINICSHGYAPEYERGVKWDSCGIKWPYPDAILSEKDLTQPTLDELFDGNTA